MDLKNVTLVLFVPDDNQERVNRASLIVEKLIENINFGGVRIVSHLKPDRCRTYWDKIPFQTYYESQIYQATELHNHFDTEFMMHCETDGYPVNFHLWKPKFLKYDYIGAPWPVHFRHSDINRVGNGGCSIQSKRLRLFLNKYKDYYKPDINSDNFICHCMYSFAIKEGLTFAPVKTALEFSFEQNIEEYPNWQPSQSFAFHGKFGYFKEYLTI